MRPLRPVLTVLVLLAVTAVAARAVPVTFAVRMQEQVALGHFDPGTDVVDLAGTFNGWGTAPLTPLADADGDTIHAVTLEGFTPGEIIEFKFRINGLWDGSEEFPGGGPNRVHQVQASGNEILVWYGDVEPYVPAPPDTSQLAWWNDTVFYEIFVRSFQDSDGDGVGDLQGLISRLDHLNDGDPQTTDDLGVTGIWLMPVNDAPSHHGYDATDYRAIHPDYGTMADFEAFLAAAHARGIRVIVDFVMNHCSTQHPWFQQARAGDPTYRDWFRWSASDPGTVGPWGQAVWHDDPSGWYYGLFWGGMPDLNYDTAAVKAEMFDAAAYWLDTVGVDGFRLDAILYIDEDGDQLQNTAGTFQFWQDFNLHVKSLDADVLSVGEAWTGSSTVVDYVTDDRLDICFEFNLAGSTLGAVNGAWAGDLANQARYAYGLYPYLQFATFLTNHDQERALTTLGGDTGKARAAAGIYLTLPGVPFLYYGEEIGMTGTKPDELIRTPMQWTGGAQAGFTTGTPWQPVNADYPTTNAADQDSDPNSLLSWYRRLIALRNGSPALRRGDYEGLDCSDGAVFAFQRRHAGQTLLCLANTSPSPRSFDVTGSAAGPAPGEHTLVNLLDAADVRTVTVTAGYAIAGLDLDGHEVAVYEFQGVSRAGAAPPRAPVLRQNVPNPFNPETVLAFDLPRDVRVRLAVHDLAGRRVALLAEGVRKAGPHRVTWRGTDDAGRPVGAGVYFARLTAGRETRLVKMTLVK